VWRTSTECILVPRGDMRKAYVLKKGFVREGSGKGEAGRGNCKLRELRTHSSQLTAQNSEM